MVELRVASILTAPTMGVLVLCPESFAREDGRRYGTLPWRAGDSIEWTLTRLLTSPME